MPVYLKDDEGKVLLVGGKVAFDADCCCGETGACCFPDGSCADFSESDCTDAGGTFYGVGTSCAIDLPPCECPCHDELPSSLSGVWTAPDTTAYPMTLFLETLGDSGGACVYSGTDGSDNHIRIRYQTSDGLWRGSFDASGIGEIWNGDGGSSCDGPTGTYGDGALVVS